MTKLYWLDIETTGLDPKKDKILEVAVAEADFDRPFDLGRTFEAVIHYSGAREALHPRVQEMHAKSGLWNRCAESLKTVHDVEEELHEWFRVSSEPGVADTLAGSSVHFDLSFLHQQMPTLAQRFSHRLYDVSAVKLFCQSIGMPKLPKAEAHEAMADVRESADHAHQCATWLGRGFNPSREKGGPA